jgi:hypothetical protein
MERDLGGSFDEFFLEYDWQAKELIDQPVKATRGSRFI